MIGAIVGVTYDRSAGVDKDNIPPEIREQLLHATSATTGKKMARLTICSRVCSPEPASRPTSRMPRCGYRVTIQVT